MQNYTKQLCFLVISMVPCVTIAMSSDMEDVCVYVKNISKGMSNNTYDIYAHMLPTLKASQSLVCPEILIPYGKMKEIGMLANINDIKTRGTSMASCWTYNKGFLEKIMQDIRESNLKLTGKNLQLMVTAGITGFYISYYNWVSCSDNYEPW